MTAHRLDPGNTGYLVKLAQLHARASFEIGADEASLRRAESYYRKAISLGRKDPRPFLELGALLMAFGRSEEGIDLLGRALDLEPRFVGAHLAMARALLETGQREAAATAFRRLEEVREELAGYHPKNGYEADLMRLDESSLSWLAERLL
jgi:tetratricopeptide (TPR) repeat protein